MRLTVIIYVGPGWTSESSGQCWGTVQAKGFSSGSESARDIVAAAGSSVQCQCQGQRQCQRQCCDSDNVPRWPAW